MFVMIRTKENLKFDTIVVEHHILWVLDGNYTNFYPVVVTRVNIIKIDGVLFRQGLFIIIFARGRMLVHIKDMYMSNAYYNI